MDGHEPMKPPATNFPFQVQWICNGHWILQRKAGFGIAVALKQEA
jgi:hypothetical protein